MPALTEEDRVARRNALRRSDLWDRVKNEAASFGELGTDLVRNAAGLPEAALSMGTGLAAQAGSGLGTAAGVVGSLVRGEKPDWDAAADTTNENTERFTFEPRSEGAKAATGGLGTVMAPLDKGINWAGEQTAEKTGSPALGALVKGGLNILDPEHIAPIAAALKGSRGLTRLIDETPESAVSSAGTMGAQRGAAALTAGKKAKKPKAAPEEILGTHPTTTPEHIAERTNTGGGYSVNLETGESPTSGLMMGKYANDDPRNLVVSGRSMSPEDARAHAAANIAALKRKENFFGTWKDAESGNTYLDVSKRFEPDERRPATKFGERTAQKAGYDVGAGESFPVGNWEEFVRSPEFHTRMDEMNQLGREVMGDKKWWDMHGGSSFERVYGKENLPQVAGFSASTSPASAPRENLQTMTEYMRRHLKGEEIIQPDWRVGPNEMTRNEGTQIGMERTRAKNLLAAKRGEIEALRENKVREMGQALMGDRNAVVLDRQWAKLAEDPAKGVYTDTTPNTVPSGAPYEVLKTEVTKAAQRAKMDPEAYSANVWEGIRDTIRRTNELYGQKHRGSQIPKESKSYSDTFEDLLQEKADHMGISKAEMEKRLRAGDATLLSLMLATPMGMALYKQSQGQQDEPAGPAA
jgi:hypothetical protein